MWILILKPPIRFGPLEKLCESGVVFLFVSKCSHIGTTIIYLFNSSKNMIKFFNQLHKKEDVTIEITLLHTLQSNNKRIGHIIDYIIVQ